MVKCTISSVIVIVTCEISCNIQNFDTSSTV